RPSLQSRRNIAWCSRRSLHWPVFLFHFAAHPSALVCGGLARCLGLGRKFSVFRARQRYGLPRPPVEFVFSRSTVAYRRFGGPGSQRLRVHSDCGHVGGVRPIVPSPQVITARVARTLLSAKTLAMFKAQ